MKNFHFCVINRRKVEIVIIFSYNITVSQQTTMGLRKNQFILEIRKGDIGK